MANPRTPAGLKRRGKALWSALVDGRELAGGGLTLAEEACRIADRLDVLDRILSGDVESWVSFRLPKSDDAEALTLVVNSALMEARQQANVLRQIVAGLPMKGGDDEDPDAAAFIDGL